MAEKSGAVRLWHCSAKWGTETVALRCKAGAEMRNGVIYYVVLRSGGLRRGNGGAKWGTET
eukprot:3247039-Rhodomonas_salina.2